jgi:hypothetical protein
MVKRPLTEKSIQQSIDRLLENDFWIPSLAPNELYSRLHDDRDGDSEEKHQLRVYVAPDADLHVFIADSMESLRFRNYFGGGKSLRVRNALMVLAEAIRRDNDDRPQE